MILTAARAFRERGYHNTSLDDIASELNVTKPTVYHYVENKEQLLFECFRAGLKQIMDGLRRDAQSSDARSARERLELVISRYAEAITSDFGWCMVQAENQDLSPAMSRKVKALKSEIDQGMRSSDPGRRSRRLDPPVRREDDGVRARRRAQLDRVLVSQRRSALRRGDREALHRAVRPGLAAAMSRRGAAKDRQKRIQMSRSRSV